MRALRTARMNAFLIAWAVTPGNTSPVWSPGSAAKTPKAAVDSGTVLLSPFLSIRQEYGSSREVNVFPSNVYKFALTHCGFNGQFAPYRAVGDIRQPLVAVLCDIYTT